MWGYYRDWRLTKCRVRRNDSFASKFDLYDLLLSGIESGDVRLQSGDVIFVPTMGANVSVSGEVLRPAIYELKDGETLGDLLSFLPGIYLVGLIEN